MGEKGPEVFIPKQEDPRPFKVGRPRKYESEEELNTAIEDYFNTTEVRHITISGLALYLGFESRQSFYDYENNEQFSYTIKRARLKIEAHYEQKLNGFGCTGSIFALKNMGWKDKTEVDNKFPDGIQVIMKNASYETKGGSGN